MSHQDADRLQRILNALHGASYVHMNLSGNNLGRDSCRPVLLRTLSGLLEQDCIVKLELSDNGLSDVLLAQLGRTLEQCGSLMTLDLSNNAVGPRTAAALGRVLANNHSIKQLWMNWNMVDGLAGAAIVKGWVWLDGLMHSLPPPHCC